MHYMLGIGKDFALGGVFFTPFPFLLQIFGKLIRVLHAWNVAACTGVAIPIPSAAYA